MFHTFFFFLSAVYKTHDSFFSVFSAESRALYISLLTSYVGMCQFMLCQLPLVI